MKRGQFILVLLVALASLLWSSGVIPAIIPQAVPVANKIGNSTQFQLGNSGAAASDCASFDSNLNITGSGTGNPCVDPTDATIYWVKDDFSIYTAPGAITNQKSGEIAWQQVGSVGMSWSNVDQDTVKLPKHPGIVQINTPATSGQTGILGFDNGAAQPQFNLTSAPYIKWHTENIVLVDNAAGSGALANIGYHFGLSDSHACTAIPGTSEGWCIMADSTAPFSCFVGAINGVTSVAWNTANWMYWQGSGVNNVCLDSGVAATANTWYDLRIDYVTATTTVTYTINSSNAQSIGQGNDTTMGKSPILRVMTHVNSSKNVWVDFFAFYGSGLTRRLGG